MTLIFTGDVSRLSPTRDVPRTQDVTNEARTTQERRRKVSLDTPPPPILYSTVTKSNKHSFTALINLYDSKVDIIFKLNICYTIYENSITNAFFN